MSNVTTKRTSGTTLTSLTRSSRDLSFKPRFRHNYGCNDDMYQFLIAYKDWWQKCLFHVDEQLVQSLVASNKLPTKPSLSLSNNDVAIDLPKLEPLPWSSYPNSQELSLLVVHNGQSVPLSVEFANSSLLDQFGRNGLIINPGGQITSMNWLSNLETLSNTHYLAVSVINNPKGIHDSINNPELSFFPKKIDNKQINSSIQIWKYDVSTTSAVLQSVYDTSNFGATSNLQWLPINITDSTSTLGVLIGAFTDGKSHLLKVSQNDEKYSKVIQTSAQYSAPSANADSAAIISYEVFDNDKVIVGMTDGCIAEYILPYSKLNDSNEPDIHIPSYITKIEDSPVNSIMVAEPEPSKFVVAVNTTGFQSKVFERENFIQGQITQLSSKTSIKPMYNHALKMFVSANAYDSISYNFIRSPQESPNSLLKCDAFISASALSTILGHPINITSTSDGDVYIINYSRKFLNGAKTTNKLLIPLKLWKLRYIDNELQLTANYEPVPPELPSQLPISPPEVVFSSVAWNENLTGSSVYSAGTISGLLIIERLDPTMKK